MAAAVATALSPLLLYACTMPVWPAPLAEIYTTPLGPFHAALYAVQLAPYLLLLVFAVAVLGGAALGRLRLKHVAFYLVAGAAVGLAAVFLAPLVMGEVEALAFSPELESLQRPAVLAATAMAGLIDGAVFWLIVRHFD